MNSLDFLQSPIALCTSPPTRRLFLQLILILQAQHELASVLRLALALLWVQVSLWELELPWMWVQGVELPSHTLTGSPHPELYNHP